MTRGVQWTHRGATIPGPPRPRPESERTDMADPQAHQPVRRTTSTRRRSATGPCPGSGGSPRPSASPPPPPRSDSGSWSPSTDRGAFSLGVHDHRHRRFDHAGHGDLVIDRRVPDHIAPVRRRPTAADHHHDVDSDQHGTAAPSPPRDRHERHLARRRPRSMAITGHGSPPARCGRSAPRRPLPSPPPNEPMTPVRSWPAICRPGRRVQPIPARFGAQATGADRRRATRSPSARFCSTSWRWRAPWRPRRPASSTPPSARR